MVNSVVDPGNFIHIEGYVLHFIPHTSFQSVPGLLQSTSENLLYLINFDFGFPQVCFVQYDQWIFQYATEREREREWVSSEFCRHASISC